MQAMVGPQIQALLALRRRWGDATWAVLFDCYAVVTAFLVGIQQKSAWWPARGLVLRASAQMDITPSKRWLADTGMFQIIKSSNS